jgi:hypothetical protein
MKLCKTTRTIKEPKLCAAERTRIIKERIPLLEQLAQLLPFYVDINLDVLRQHIIKQIKTFTEACDTTEFDKFYASLPNEKPKPRKPITPRQPRQYPPKQNDNPDKPPEKIKIDIPTVKTIITSEPIVDLNNILNKIKDSYREFYPRSSVKIIELESTQILSRAVYKIIFEQYKNIIWRDWASTLKTLYFHVELQKQIIELLKPMQNIVSNMDEQQLKESHEIPKEKSELLTGFLHLLYEWEESLNITKNNIEHMKDILEENKLRLQKQNRWEKETPERSEVSKEASKIPATLESLKHTHQALKTIHANLYTVAPVADANITAICVAS